MFPLPDLCTEKPQAARPSTGRLEVPSLHPGDRGARKEFHFRSRIPPDALSLLDVGCNVGEALRDHQRYHPNVKLSGVDLSAAAIQTARTALPDADLRVASATSLPFTDESFDCVTCIEVLEHVREDLRAKALAEMRRVLKPGGSLVLEVPHAGWFSWLDPQNFRLRWPWLYKRLVREGLRDPGYPNGESDLVWHHHFTVEELLSLAGDGWRLESLHRGGLFLVPVMDIACWPLYRSGRVHNRIFRAFQKTVAFDLSCNYGATSYVLLLLLRRL